MFAIGNDELEANRDIGEMEICPGCKKEHKVKFGEKKDEDGNIVPDNILAFIKCNEDGALYLVGIAGKAIGK